MTYDAIFKVVVFGDAGCGKTTLTKRYVTDLFIPDSKMTIGVDFEITDVRFNGVFVKLCQSSLSHVHEWLSVINGNDIHIPIILVGGKADLDKYREISYKEGLKVANSLDLNYFMECSSKTGENVEKIFEKLTEMMVKIAIVY